jgi:hypothetical protein
MKILYKLMTLIIAGAVVMTGSPASAASLHPHRDAVVVEDVKIPVTGQAPVSAYLVRPQHRGHASAGVLYLHWFAPPASTQNRTEFLSEAVDLASRAR